MTKTITFAIALATLLGACTSESTTMANDEPDGSGGSDYGTATQTASIGGSSVTVTTVVQFVEVPKDVIKLSACVPGAQNGCTCTDGSNGAQVCQDDGTMGVCECEVPLVETEQCAVIATATDSISCRFNSMKIRVNCDIELSKSLGISSCETPLPDGPLGHTTGVVCCV